MRFETTFPANLGKNKLFEPNVFAALHRLKCGQNVERSLIVSWNHLLPSHPLQKFDQVSPGLSGDSLLPLDHKLCVLSKFPQHFLSMIPVQQYSSQLVTEGG